MQAVTAFKRWLFRLYGPEAAPIVLTQRRVYVLPTGAGMAYGMSLVLMLVGAINYNLSLGYALVFLLAGLGFVALLHTFRNLVLLELYPGRAEPVFAGETAHFGLQVHNRRVQGRFSVEFCLDGGQTVCCDLPAQSTHSVSLPRPATQRGWLHAGRVTLQTRFPLGLVRAWSYVEPDMRCLVYPRPEDAAPPVPYSHGGERSSDGTRGGNDDFSGLRNHQPADSPKHIAWKAAAREQALLTKQFSGASSSQVWLDWNTLPPDMDTEARLARLTRWVLDAHVTELVYGLSLPGWQAPPDQGVAHYQKCLKALALHGR